MSEIEFDYSIRSCLPAHPESPASLGPKFLDTLDALSRIGPAIFTNWQLLVLPDIEFLLDVEERFGAAAAAEKVETYSLGAACPALQRLSRRMSPATISASRCPIWDIA